MSDEELTLDSDLDADLDDDLDDDFEKYSIFKFRAEEDAIGAINYLKEITDKRYPNKNFVMYQGIDPNDWTPKAGMELKHPCVGLLQSANIWGKTSEMLVLEPIIKSNPQIFFYWAGGGPSPGGTESVQSIDPRELHTRDAAACDACDLRRQGTTRPQTVRRAQEGGLQ